MTHVEQLRVAWADTDASGRIHFTAVFRYAEVAEHGLLRKLHAPELGVFPRRHVEATYHRALHFEDPIELRLGVENVGRTSITYVWKIFRDGVVCVEGRMIVVHVGTDGRAEPVPDDLRRGLTAETR